MDVARLLVRVLRDSSVSMSLLNDKNCVSSKIEDSRHFVVGVVNYRRNVILSIAKNLLLMVR